jgi:hypothetical protein
MPLHVSYLPTYDDKMQKIFKQLINRPDFDLFLHLLEIK